MLTSFQPVEIGGTGKPPIRQSAVSTRNSAPFSFRLRTSPHQRANNYGDDGVSCSTALLEGKRSTHPERSISPRDARPDCSWLALSACSRPTSRRPCHP